jgi:hypothetical protein
MAIEDRWAGGNGRTGGLTGEGASVSLADRVGAPKARVALSIPRVVIFAWLASHEATVSLRDPLGDVGDWREVSERYITTGADGNASGSLVSLHSNWRIRELINRGMLRWRAARSDAAPRPVSR